METWFASLKNEEIYPKRPTPSPKPKPRARLFDYIWDYNHPTAPLIAGLCRTTIIYASPIKYLSVKPG